MFYKPVIKDHLLWLNDVGRNRFYQETITATCKNKICVDVGAGSGILTDYALEAGASHVYCVEIRKARANFLREKYQNKNVTVIEQDFLNTKIQDADIFFIEQIGCQFNNNFSIKKFMSHIKKNNPAAITLPNRYTIKAYIFDGIIEDHPQMLINSKYLPIGFYDHCQTQLSINPAEIVSVYELNKNNVEEDITFLLDLSHYKDCTIFFDDDIYFNDCRCEYENVYRCETWDKPYKIYLKECKSKIQFCWNNQTFEIKKVD
jgi:predicted RNA methylase